MICVLLAAGYATRMYPLTENFPKPLLEIKERLFSIGLLMTLLYQARLTDMLSSQIINSCHISRNGFH
jgi:glucose-1-phosphate thymidylyltransferase